MRILVVGGGGREHALCWAIRQELPGADLYVAPGNPGTADLATNLAIAATDLDRIADAVDMYGIELTVIGPELPLALGLADRLRAEGRLAFGPSRAAARIESSKAFAKELMHAANVPTALSEAFTELAPALAFIDRQDEPLVVKASGLAAGKGAVVCGSREEARDVVREMLEGEAFGAAGRELIIEAYLRGEELSVFALTDGREVQLLPAAQDHKRLLEGDQGPNTGGMGAYAPVSLANKELLGRITEEILLPTLHAMRQRGTPYSGLLYAGLMVDDALAPSVVEFNCRFGDPETQAVLPLLQGGLVDALHAVASGQAPRSVRADPNRHAVTTVVAARGYPEHPIRGDEITLPDTLPDQVLLFHAGTTRDAAGTLRTDGGRVMAVTGLGVGCCDAHALSAAGAALVQFEGSQYRPDIGWRETARERDAGRRT